jgi:AcrR family transcriptional regulator
VLAAARELFSELGFDRTTMMAEAARAGVDPALIHHYFGNKDGLLAATLTPPAAAAKLLTGVFDDPENAGAELVRRVIDVWETHLEVREQMAAMLRTGFPMSMPRRCCGIRIVRSCLQPSGASWPMTAGSFERPSSAAILPVCCWRATS